MSFLSNLKKLCHVFTERTDKVCKYAADLIRYTYIVKIWENGVTKTVCGS